MNWRELYKKRKWEDIDSWWPHADPTDQRELLEKLREDVPRVRKRNGMELVEEHIHPKDAPDAWKGATMILHLGELEVEVEGDPPIASVEWQKERDRAARIMRRFLDTEEPTSGEERLSRKAHAQHVLDYLDRIDRETKLILNQLDPERYDAEDRAWLGEVIAQALLPAFHAGAHARAAAGKEIESHAVRGEKVLSGAIQGAVLRAAQKAAGKQDLLSCMQALIDEGHSASRAAELAFRKGLGTSAEGNRTAWKRHKKVGPNSPLTQP